MKRSLATQYFRCTRLHAVLTRASCARNHKLAHRPPPPRGTERSAATYRCKDCPVGAEHERGKASAPPVTLVQVRARAERPEPERRCMACGRVLELGHWRKSYCNLSCYSAGMRLAHIERLAEMSV